ncbi:MAG: hypothetical protein ACOX1W_02530 [Catenisphaera adipataccumulans]|jgi:hypothetical protein|uniref:hypothetical protein n=1 Tax=Catenisphaera adipataccumulans TaxID=700500 RepID=UPI003D90F4D5
MKKLWAVIKKTVLTVGSVLLMIFVLSAITEHAEDPCGWDTMPETDAENLMHTVGSMGR